MAPRRTHSREELEAAIEALSEPGRFRDAEAAVASAAPALQAILTQALEAGGWFAESHEAEARKAVEPPDAAERLVAVRTLLAEEARIGMMVGVAVGWALAEELSRTDDEPTRTDKPPTGTDKPPTGTDKPPKGTDKED